MPMSDAQRAMSEGVFGALLGAGVSTYRSSLIFTARGGKISDEPSQYAQATPRFFAKTALL